MNNIKDIRLMVKYKGVDKPQSMSLEDTLGKVEEYNQDTINLAMAFVRKVYGNDPNIEDMYIEVNSVLPAPVELVRCTMR